MQIIIDKVHIEMFNKAKLMRKNLKYKLYNWSIEMIPLSSFIYLKYFYINISIIF